MRPSGRSNSACFPDCLAEQFAKTQGTAREHSSSGWIHLQGDDVLLKASYSIRQCHGHFGYPIGDCAKILFLLCLGIFLRAFSIMLLVMYGILASIPFEASALSAIATRSCVLDVDRHVVHLNSVDGSRN